MAVCYILHLRQIVWDNATKTQQLLNTDELNGF